MTGANRICIFYLIIVFLVGVFFAECEDASTTEESHSTTQTKVKCSFTITHGEVNASKNWPGAESSANVTCYKDYEIHGLAKIDCYPNGSLSANPKCQKIPASCKDIRVNNGTVKYYGNWPRSGGWGIVTCDRNFEIDDLAKVTCQNDGRTNRKPKCIKIPPGCSEPKVLNGNRTHHGDWNRPGSWVNVTCDKGYEIIGSAKVICGSNGNWTVALPKCVIAPKKFCEKVTVFNGKVSYHGSWPRPGGFVKVECLKGYKMFGLSKMICNENGRYDAAPVCVERSGFEERLPMFLRFKKEVTNISMVKIALHRAAKELEVDNVSIAEVIVIAPRPRVKRSTAACSSNDAETRARCSREAQSPGERLLGNLVRVDFNTGGNPYAYVTLLSRLEVDPSRLRLSDGNTATAVIEGNQLPLEQTKSEEIPGGAIVAIVILSFVLLLSLINLGIIVYKGPETIESRDSRGNSSSTLVIQPKEQNRSTPSTGSKTLKLSSDDPATGMVHTALEMSMPIQRRGSRGATVPMDKTQLPSLMESKKDKVPNESSTLFTGRQPSSRSGSSGAAVKEFHALTKAMQDSVAKAQQSNAEKRLSVGNSPDSTQLLTNISQVNKLGSCSDLFTAMGYGNSNSDYILRPSERTPDASVAQPIRNKRASLAPQPRKSQPRSGSSGDTL